MEWNQFINQGFGGVEYNEWFIIIFIKLVSRYRVCWQCNAWYIYGSLNSVHNSSPGIYDSYLYISCSIPLQTLQLAKVFDIYIMQAMFPWFLVQLWQLKTQYFTQNYNRVGVKICCKHIQNFGGTIISYSISCIEKSLMLQQPGLWAETIIKPSLIIIGYQQ